MIATPLEIGAAIGATNLVINGTESNPHVISCDGLPLATAQARVSLIAKHGNLAPDAEAYQVRAWMIRNGISEAAVVAIIESITTAGPERAEALMRWECVTRVPKSHPLVAAVAAGLGVSVDSIWWTILDIS